MIFEFSALDALSTPRLWVRTLGVVALIALVALGCDPPRRQVQLELEAVDAVGERVRCGHPVAFGEGRWLELGALRFYLHDLALQREQGDWVRPEFLDTPHTGQGVALIDLYDDRCEANRSPGRSRAVTLLVPGRPERYRAVRFTLGVPEQLNHLDPMRAPPHLADTSMHWGWQAGYRFLRLDGKLKGQRRYAVHLGSAGCEGEIGQVTRCAYPNRFEVEIQGEVFGPGHVRETVLLDLAALLGGAEPERGCMSDPQERECEAIFKALRGEASESSESVFRLAPRQTLGEALFFDRALSASGQRSCASCHRPEGHFGGPPHAPGEVSVPTLRGVAGQRRLGRANPLVRRLEDQVQLALFSDDPVEMGWAGARGELAAVARATARYCEELAGGRWRAELKRCEGGERDEARLVARLIEALSSYQRELKPWPHSRVDAWLEGSGELDASPRLGAELFYGSAECASCHSGEMFSDAYRDGSSEGSQHPPGYYRVRAPERVAEPRRLGVGLRAWSLKAEDHQRFKTPTLRGLSGRAYFFHDGWRGTLEGALSEHAPELNEAELRALAAFIRALDEPA